MTQLRKPFEGHKPKIQNLRQFYEIYNKKTMYKSKLPNNNNQSDQINVLNNSYL